MRNELKSLKEYLEFYSMFGISELQIVEIYIKDKHLETEYSNMAIRLTANRLQYERERFSWAREVSASAYMKHLDSYTEEENAFLNRLTRDLAFNPENCLSYFEKDIREKIPNMLMPNCCFMDVIAVINHKYKVRFKNQTEDQEFMNGYYKEFCELSLSEEKSNNMQE